MSGENTTPTKSDSEDTHFLWKTLNGWEEIRSALLFVEELRAQEKHDDARLEVYEHSGDSSLKVSFRTLCDLDDYLQSKIRGVLLKDENEGACQQLDVMSEVRGQFVMKKSE